jgi:hypothetical protein
MQETAMNSEPAMETKKPIIDASPSVDYGNGETESVIYIDPAREAACRKKFDTYVVPVSVIFLVLSTLDRNNVSDYPSYSMFPKSESSYLTFANIG